MLVLVEIISHVHWCILERAPVIDPPRDRYYQYAATNTQSRCAEESTEIPRRRTSRERKSRFSDFHLQPKIACLLGAVVLWKNSDYEDYGLIYFPPVLQHTTYTHRIFLVTESARQKCSGVNHM